MSDKEEVKAGQEFNLQIGADTTPDQVRAAALEKYGREVHIKAKFGPLQENKGGGLVGDMVAIDDPFLDGKFSLNIAEIMQDGTIIYDPTTVVYMGYFK